VARDLIVLRSGPRHATARREVALPGGKGLLLVVSAVDSPSADGTQAPDAAQVQRDLADAIVSAVAASKGSATARVRGAIDHAHALLRRRRAINPASDPVAARVGVLLLIGDELLVALVGPWIALATEPSAEPLTSEAGPATGKEVPSRGRVALLAPTDSAPMGTDEPWADAEEPPPISWSQLRLRPGASVLVAAAVDESEAAGFPDRLADADPRDAQPLLDAAVPRHVPALYVARPPVHPAGAPRAPVPETFGEPRREIDDNEPGTAQHRSGQSAERRPSDRRPALDAPSALRSGVAAAMRLVSRVVRGMLPTRAGPGEYREDWARAAAAVAIAIPIGVILLTVAMRTLVGDAGPDTGTEGATVPDDLSTSQAAAGMATPGDGVVPASALGASTELAGLAAVAELPGAPADVRRIVAVGGRPFVLDLGTDSVVQAIGGATAPVLARGQVAGDETVAELLDMFWLPAPGGGSDGRVAVLDAAGRLWTISAAGVELAELSIEPQWGAVSIGSGYDGNLYALDRSAGQIYRYLPADGAFPNYPEPGQAWLARAEPLTTAVDMAIDGAIYALNQDGGVSRWIAGQRDDAPGLDQARTTDASALYTSPTAGRLLIADRQNGRVVVLSADGDHVADLVPPAADSRHGGKFGVLHDVWWDEAGGKLYAVDGVELLEAPYH